VAGATEVDVAAGKLRLGEGDGAVGELGVAGVDVVANVSRAVVSKRIGHSSIALTADTCSYLLGC
jgi:hypothetical protein